MSEQTIAVLIPCYNESLTLQQVIADFKRELPQALIYVFDNGSTDNSVAIAKTNGAIVKQVRPRGKGHVVRRMFADVNSDIYIMVDGDNTYQASCVPQALQLMQTQDLDMVVCTRQATAKKSFRLGHRLGNKLFTKLINILFHNQCQDVFSGFRVFSKRFVKSFPTVSKGFEIEVEMTIHALSLSMPIAEIPSQYQERPEGSVSKLRTIQDGSKILWHIIIFFYRVRPFALLSSIALCLIVFGFALGLPIVINFYHTGLVPRLPTVVLTAALMTLAGICGICGIILNSISELRLETRRFWYLHYS